MVLILRGSYSTTYIDFHVFNLQVETFGFRRSILKIAEQRNDTWGKQVKKRILPVNDLVAADAEYHRACHKKFILKVAQKKVGRPEDELVNAAMEKIYCILEDSDDCQHSINDLIDELDGYVMIVLEIKNVCSKIYHIINFFLSFCPDLKTVKYKLLQKYGEQISITTLKNRTPVVSFKTVGHKILSDHSYASWNDDAVEEKARIIKAVADIILQDCESRVYDTNTYPASDDFLRDAEEQIPPSLMLLIESKSRNF